MVFLNSGRIFRVTFNEKSGKMKIWFMDGSVYEYENVTRNIFRQITRSKSADGESAGIVFNRLVRSNPDKYPYKRLQ